MKDFIVSSYQSPEQTLSQQEENEEKQEEVEKKEQEEESKEKNQEIEKPESMQIPNVAFLKYWQEVPGIYRIAIFPVWIASASAIILSAVGVENIFTQTPFDLIAPLNHLLLTAGTVAFSTTFILHLMHISIQMPKNHGEYTFFQQLGQKWQSLNPWERFLTATAITLSVLTIFSACYLPEFGLCQDFLTELNQAHLIAGATTVGTLVSTVHIYSLYHSQPPVKTTPQHESGSENFGLRK